MEEFLSLHQSNRREANKADFNRSTAGIDEERLSEREAPVIINGPGFSRCVCLDV